MLKMQDAKIGEDVIVKVKDCEVFNQIGEIWKVTNYWGEVKVSVSFDGQIYNFSLDDLVLA
jgi:hypothetical protein